MTKYEAAEKAGLNTYDCALPQQWLDGTVKTLKENTGFGRAGVLPDNLYDIILSGTVWCYDNSLMGYPYPLTYPVMEYLRMAGEIEFENHLAGG